LREVERYAVSPYVLYEQSDKLAVRCLISTD